MKTILVTGGTGYIGSHTCISLIQNGFRVIIFDSLVNSSIECVNKIKLISREKDSLIYPEIEFICGDIRDINNIENIFKKANESNNPIEAVIHFAGLKSVFESIRNPIRYWENNVLGSINLVKVMEKYNCNDLIFSSSATIYGKENPNILVEESNVNPTNPYGQTKLTIENMLRDLTLKKDSKWRVVCLRYFNPIGAHESGILGESAKSFTQNIFPLINKVAIGIIDKIEIFGNDYPTLDGTGIRDYIHVVDLAEGHIAALDYINQFKKKFIVVNLGTGEGTSVLELIKVFENVNNCKVNYVFSDRREGDIASVIANNSLALKLFKWNPKRDIFDMCKDGWNFQNKNPKGF